MGIRLEHAIMGGIINYLGIRSNSSRRPPVDDIVAWVKSVLYTQLIDERDNVCELFCHKGSEVRSNIGFVKRECRAPSSDILTTNRVRSVLAGQAVVEGSPGKLHGVRPLRVAFEGGRDPLAGAWNL
eukprot:4984797-Pyramimonas_sp.AAC.1